MEDRNKSCTSDHISYILQLWERVNGCTRCTLQTFSASECWRFNLRPSINTRALIFVTKRRMIPANLLVIILFGGVDTLFWGGSSGAHCSKKIKEKFDEAFSLRKISEKKAKSFGLKGRLYKTYLFWRSRYQFLKVRGGSQLQVSGGVHGGADAQIGYSFAIRANTLSTGLRNAYLELPTEIMGQEYWWTWGMKRTRRQWQGLLQWGTT